MDKNQELTKYIIAKKKRKYIRKNNITNQVKEIPDKLKFIIKIEESNEKNKIILEY